MERVLLLGAQGMLGQALRQVFTGEQVTAWDKAEVDITNEAEVSARITELAPTLIINAAAYTAVDMAETETTVAHAVNETGVRNVAQVAKEIEATLVHYSTDYVFPGDRAEGYTEEVEPGPPVNAYGASKLAGERALAAVAPRYYLVRTAWLYGPGGANFVDTMLRVGRERDSLTVVNDQHGSPTYTVDLAWATKQLIQEGYEPGIYHLVNEGVTTWHQFAQEIFAQAGLSVTVEPVSSAEYPLAAKRPQYSRLQNTKGPALRPWQEALAAYIELQL